MVKLLAYTITAISIIGCQEEQPSIYEGTSLVYASDGEISDTLKLCYCWQTKDSLALRITYGPFMGISISVIGKNNVHSTSLEYYSDTNEFNGEFNLPVSIEKDSLVITYQTRGDSIQVSGYFDIISEEVEFYGDGRKILTSGSFKCTMRKN